MHAEQPAELSERQLLIVDMNDDIPVRPAVVDDAAEHVAARDPLIAVLVIVDLFLPRRFFDDRLVPCLRGAPTELSRMSLYISTTSASVIDAMSADDARAGEVRVGIVDNRVVSLAVSSRRSPLDR